MSSLKRSRVSKLSKLSSSKRMSSVTFHGHAGMARKLLGFGKGKIGVPERLTYKILLDGDDVTPKTLTPPIISSDEQQLAVHEMSNTSGSIIGNVSQQQQFQTQLHDQTAKAETTFLSIHGTVGTFGTSGDMKISVQEAPHQRYESEGDIENPYPSEPLNLPALTVDETLPNKINLVLKETPVVFLLEIVSKIVPREEPESYKVDNDNEYYNYLTIGKGRNRKRLNAEAQTDIVVLKTRSTTMKHIKRRHSEMFASGWDMLDSAQSGDQKIETVTKTNISDVDPNTHERRLREAFLDTAQSTIEIDDNESAMKALQETVAFQNATMIMERILDGNVFEMEQTRIRGLHPPCPFSKEIEFKYELELLWTFHNEHVFDRPITQMDFNKKNPDIIAVSYGKFFFAEKKHGMVCIWNIKNPSQPERQYSFPVAATGVSFAETQPNILAVSFYDGTIGLLDIIYTEVKFVVKTNKYNSLTIGPIWSIKHLYQSGYDRLMVTSEDGRVCVYRRGKTTGLIGVQLMRVTRMEGKLKGIKQLRMCSSDLVPINCYAHVTCFVRVPYDDTLYLIGTDEGTIHKCSQYYLNQHIEIFLAHNGPVYEIAYSPFCNRIFLTCGADWAIRIWSEGIFEPLITLNVPLICVQMAVWNPQNSTIITGVCGSSIYIWDLKKKTYFPSSVTQSPSKVRITTLAVTASGYNLLIGDLEGKLHLLSLEKIPFPPFYQRDALLHAIKKSLITRPDLIKQLNRTMQEFKIIESLKPSENIEKIMNMFGG